MLPVSELMEPNKSESQRYPELTLVLELVKWRSITSFTLGSAKLSIRQNGFTNISSSLIRCSLSSSFFKWVVKSTRYSPASIKTPNAMTKPIWLLLGTSPWSKRLHGRSDSVSDLLQCFKKVTSLAYATHSKGWVLNDQKISRETMSWHCKQVAKVITSHHTYDSLCFSLPFATRQLKCFAIKKHLCLKTIKNLPFAMLFFNLVRLCFSLRGTEEKATKGNSHNKPCSCDGRTCQCQASSYSSWIASILDGFWTCKRCHDLSKANGFCKSHLPGWSSTIRGGVRVWDVWKHHERVMFLSKHMSLQRVFGRPGGPVAFLDNMWQGAVALFP